jgi:hypothetical protein
MAKQDPFGGASRLTRNAAREQQGRDRYRYGSWGRSTTASRRTPRGTVKTTKQGGKTEAVKDGKLRATTTESYRDGQIRRKIERQNRAAFKSSQAKKRK